MVCFYRQTPERVSFRLIGVCHRQTPDASVRYPKPVELFTRLAMYGFGPNPAGGFGSC